MRILPLSTISGVGLGVGLTAGAAFAGGGTLDGTVLELRIQPLDSPFTWSGTSTAGPLGGNHDFVLQGDVQMRMGGNNQPLQAAGFQEASALVLPDIEALLPNPGGNQPAGFFFINARLGFESPTFLVGPQGFFLTSLDPSFVGGGVSVIPPNGPASLIALSNIEIPAIPVSGTLVYPGQSIQLTLPLHFSFQIQAPGLSGEFTFDGTLIASLLCRPPQNYCMTSANSVGSGALMDHAGTTSVFNNDLVLIATDCPPNNNGLFYYGVSQIAFPFGDGFRCIGNFTQRLPVIATSDQGVAVWALEVDQNDIPPPARIDAGETWNFQFWYRDQVPGGSGFNLSDGLEVFFCL